MLYESRAEEVSIVVIEDIKKRHFSLLAVFIYRIYFCFISFSLDAFTFPLFLSRRQRLFLFKELPDSGHTFFYYYWMNL